MDDTKKAWTSKSMWAGVVLLIVINLKSFGLVDISEADQAAIVDTIVQSIENAAVLFGMYGRYKADKIITL